MMTTFGGSLQAVCARFTLLDDTEHHPAGSSLYSADLVRATYARRRDGSLGLRIAFCRPDPVMLQFVVGGDIRYDDAGEMVGWSDPQVIPDTRRAVDLWSANISQGAIIGYYRWSAPECVATCFAGSALDGQNASMFRAATTVDLRAGFHLTAENTLPAELPNDLNRHVVLSPRSEAVA